MENRNLDINFICDTSYLSIAIMLRIDWGIYCTYTWLIDK